MRYLRVIVAREPHYNLTRGNCFWFSRNLIHVLALRHYSFAFVATGTTLSTRPPDKSDDPHKGTAPPQDSRNPSSIELLFTFFYAEEQKNGILMYRRTIILLSAAFLIYGVYACIHAFRDKPRPKWGTGITLATIICLAPSLALFLDLAVGFLVERTARATTLAIVEELGMLPSGILPILILNLTEQDYGPYVRGDFIPEYDLHFSLLKSLRFNFGYHLQNMKRSKSLWKPWERVCGDCGNWYSGLRQVFPG
jgi:hypothetical protein